LACTAVINHRSRPWATDPSPRIPAHGFVTQAGTCTPLGRTPPGFSSSKARHGPGADLGEQEWFVREGGSGDSYIRRSERYNGVRVPGCCAKRLFRLGAASWRRPHAGGSPWVASWEHCQTSGPSSLDLVLLAGSAAAQPARGPRSAGPCTDGQHDDGGSCAHRRAYGSCTIDGIRRVCNRVARSTSQRAHGRGV
jgi:hypothetical protein